jgi:hypothetical protein
MLKVGRNSSPLPRILELYGQMEENHGELSHLDNKALNRDLNLDLLNMKREW